MLLCLLVSALLAGWLIALYLRRNRQARDFEALSQQIWKLASEAGVAGRLRLDGRNEDLGRLSSAVNKLLENLEQRGAQLNDRERLFHRLVETVHDAVLAIARTILFANARFLAMLGTNAEDGRRQVARRVRRARVRGPGGQNLRRRLAGEPAAERYEVELVSQHGQVTRVELSSTLIDSAGQSALLLTALEMLPRRPRARARRRGRARL